MSGTAIASAILLAAGLVVVVASCVSMAIMDDPLDRLHMVTPASMLGVVGVCAAIVVRTGLSSSGLAAILVGVFAVGTSPFVSHAIARAILVRSGDPMAGERSRAEGGDET